jgi:NAD(P)-dependent dehydrogenase (short-subunit alcohol dehydrogenase family)
MHVLWQTMVQYIREPRMLSGRVFILTGSTGGLGFAIGHVLLAEGVRVVAVGRDQDELDSLRTALQASDDNWLGTAADLTHPGGADAVVQAAVARFGRLDGVIAAAGGWRGGQPVAETDPATLDWLWQTNVLTVFNILHASLPSLMANGWGRVVTFGARSALQAQARSGAYGASKAAVVVLTQALAAETRGSGVTANVLVPSIIDTPTNRAAMPDADHSKWATPEQFAAAVRFLCSEEASAISGAAIPIYGRA